MSPGYAKVPNSWSHILFLTVVYACSCNWLLYSQLFLYITVVVLMTLFLIFWYNPSEKLHPLVGWITKRTWKRDCLSSVPWISEHETMVTSLTVRTGKIAGQETTVHNKLRTVCYGNGRLSFWPRSQTDVWHIVPIIPPPPHLFLKTYKWYFPQWNTSQTF